MSSGSVRVKSVTCWDATIEWDQVNNESVIYRVQQTKPQKADIYVGNDSECIIPLNHSTEYTLRISYSINKKEENEKTIGEVKFKTPEPPFAVLSHVPVTEMTQSIMKSCAGAVFPKPQSRSADDKQQCLSAQFGPFTINIFQDTLKEDKFFMLNFSAGADSRSVEAIQDAIKDENKFDYMWCLKFIPDMPMYLILELLKEGPVFLTGKGIGGTMAATVGYILLTSCSSTGFHVINAWEELVPGALGVCGFGSPAFSSGRVAGILLKLGYLKYFYNIITEGDIVPVFFDSLNSDNVSKQSALINKSCSCEIYSSPKSYNQANEHLKDWKKEKGLVNHRFAFNKVQFGTVMFLNRSLELSVSKDFVFHQMYFENYRQLSDEANPLKLYNKFGNKITDKLVSETVSSLTNNSTSVKSIKLVSRVSKNTDGERLQSKVFRCELPKHMTSDTIGKVFFITKDGKEVPCDKVIFNDANTICCMIDNTSIHFDKIELRNKFGGKDTCEKIVNIRGEGESDVLIKEEVERIFSLVFFKLIRIMSSVFEKIGEDSDDESDESGPEEELDDRKVAVSAKSAFEETKDKALDEIKKFEKSGLNEFLKSFNQEIGLLDKLFSCTRPDLLATNENIHLSNTKALFKEYTEEGYDITTRNVNVRELIARYYEAAKGVQEDKKINLSEVKADRRSFASDAGFPVNMKGVKCEGTKLFVCDTSEDLKSIFNDKASLSKDFAGFTIVNQLCEMISGFKRLISSNFKVPDFRDKRNYEEFTKRILSKSFDLFIKEKIGELYKGLVLPPVFCLTLFITSSFEGMDQLKFFTMKDKFCQKLHIPSWLEKALIVGGTTLAVGALVAAFATGIGFGIAAAIAATPAVIPEVLITGLNVVYAGGLITTAVGGATKAITSIGSSLMETDNYYDLVSMFNTKGKRNMVNQARSAESIFDDMSKLSFEKPSLKVYYQLLKDIIDALWLSEDSIQNMETSLSDMLSGSVSQHRPEFKRMEGFINTWGTDSDIKKNLVQCVKQVKYIGALRTTIEEEFTIGVFGKKNSGKSTVLKTLFKGCEGVGSGTFQSTIGLDMYSSENGLKLLDCPGSTESNETISGYNKIGYKYIKMIIYVVETPSTINAETDPQKDICLKEAIELKKANNIPMVIFFTKLDIGPTLARASGEKKWKTKKYIEAAGEWLSTIKEKLECKDLVKVEHEYVNFPGISSDSALSQVSTEANDYLVKHCGLVFACETAEHIKKLIPYSYHTGFRDNLYSVEKFNEEK